MKHNLPLGVSLALIATFLYSSQTALIKAYASLVPLPMVLFTMSWVSLVLFMPFLFRKGWRHAHQTMQTKDIGAHLLRACCSLGVGYLLFSAIKFIPIVNAMLLANASPLIVPFFAYFIFKQPINHSMWGPILMGFVGVMLVLHPDSQLFHSAAFLGVAAAFCAALGIILVRRLSRTNSSETIMFYFFFISTLISGAVAVGFWQTISFKMLMILIVVGVFYFACQYLFTIALRFASAQLMGSLLYMNIVYTAVIAACVWRTWPDQLTMLGILLTVVGGILCIRAEHRRKGGEAVVQGVDPVTQGSAT